MRVGSFAYRDRYSKCVLSLFFKRDLSFPQGRPESKEEEERGCSHSFLLFSTAVFFFHFASLPEIVSPGVNDAPARP